VGYNRTAKPWQQERRPEARVPIEKPANDEGTARETAERGGFAWERERLLERERAVRDDDETARYVLRRLLADTPYGIIEASGGLEGLRRAREERPQVVFLDLTMPEMSGFEALERLKSDPATHDIPVIIITSKTLGHEERQLLDGKVVALLSKETASHEAVIAGVRQALAGAGSVPKQRPEGAAPQHG
jgi:CheY-like chemotaxis protein